jgi:hypothetical protein
VIKKLNSGIYQVDITEDMYDEAMSFAEINYVNNKYSMMSGKDSITSNLTGNLGEVIFQTVFPKAERINNLDYDFIHNGKKIDVKTKKVSSIPNENFDISIFAYSLPVQKCSHYVFCRVRDDFRIGWLLGWISKEEFKSRAKLYKTGDIDELNNFRFKKDSYNLLIKDLYKFKI